MRVSGRARQERHTHQETTAQAAAALGLSEQQYRLAASGDPGADPIHVWLVRDYRDRERAQSHAQPKPIEVSEGYARTAARARRSTQPIVPRVPAHRPPK